MSAAESIVNGLSSAHLQVLMSWFTTREQTLAWGGPDFRYPFTLESFLQDVKANQLRSLCVVDQSVNLLAFGQCYDRLGCCHFGRLVISPQERGRGLVRVLMRALMQEAESEFLFSELSLFVLEHNESARRVYERLGFTYLEYPEPNAWNNILYMRAPKSVLSQVQ